MRLIIAFWRRLTFRDGEQAPSYATQGFTPRRRWLDHDEDVMDQWYRRRLDYGERPTNSD